ncbi:MAG: hypothetical protein NTU79_02865 [Planctomycetota bacterium]|nr:hypothetical protein [Planctomycetota bacterium]
MVLRFSILPLASGLLAEKFTGETKFAKDDHRNYNADGNADGNAFNVGETFAGLPLAKPDPRAYPRIGLLECRAVVLNCFGVSAKPY